MPASGRLPDVVVAARRCCHRRRLRHRRTRRRERLPARCCSASPMLVTHLARPAGLGFGDVKFALLLGAGIGVLAPASCCRRSCWRRCSTSPSCLAVGARGRLVPFGPALALGSAVVVASGYGGREATPSSAAFTGVSVAAVDDVRRRGGVSVEPLDWADMGGWLDRVEPVDALVELARWLGLALAVYVAAVSLDSAARGGGSGLRACHGSTACCGTSSGSSLSPRSAGGCSSSRLRRPSPRRCFTARRPTAAAARAGGSTRRRECLAPPASAIGSGRVRGLRRRRRARQRRAGVVVHRSRPATRCGTSRSGTTATSTPTSSQRGRRQPADRRPGPDPRRLDGGASRAGTGSRATRRHAAAGDRGRGNMGRRSGPDGRHLWEIVERHYGHADAELV